MDPDTLMLQLMGSALTALQVKFKLSSIDDRADLRPQLMEAMQNFAAYQMKLLKDEVVTTQADLDDMKAIRDEIDAAGDKQSTLMAIARVVGFISARI
jgi:hypothetical protein